MKQSRDKALEFLESISRNLDTNTEQVYIEKCISNIIDNQTHKMTEMEDTVKQLTQDEAELRNKLSRRKLELERVEKRLKGLETFQPRIDTRRYMEAAKAWIAIQQVLHLDGRSFNR